MAQVAANAINFRDALRQIRMGARRRTGRRLRLGAGLSGGARPKGRKWCPEEDSNLHDLAIAST
jgi:hypothetical protein